VLDLDPKGAPFTDVVKVARALHAILDDLALPSYVKTSGASGLHIVLPLGAGYDYEVTRTFARLLAVMGVEAEPEISTIARPLRSRGGKVYIDFGQNGRGQTVVAPFSARPLPGAPVSCPLRWEEVTARLDPVRRIITGSEVIIWRNITSKPATELQFHLYWNAWRDDRSTWLRETKLGSRRAVPNVTPDDRSRIDVTSRSRSPASRRSRRGSPSAPA
jgi:hypothetical protein